MTAGLLRPLLGWLLVVGTVATVLVATGVGAQEPRAAELTAEQATRAAAIYANSCSQCHGGDAEGGVTIPGTNREGPPLAGTDDVGVAYLDLVLRTGRMPPPESPFDNRPREVAFSDEERRILVAWMAEEFAIGGDIPDPTGMDATRGRGLYARNCAQCHGATGEGGVAGGGAYTPRINNLDPIAIAEAIRVGPFAMPAFNEEQLSQEELGDVAAFLEEVEAEEGTPIGLVELNPVFASGFAALLALAVLFSLFWIAGRPTLFPDAPSTKPAPDAQVPATGAEDQA